MNLRLTLRACSVAATLSMAACHWGTRIKNFTPSKGPDGARVAIRVGVERADRVGELYSAADSGVILGEMQSVGGRPTRLSFVPWERLWAMDVQRAGADLDVRPGEPLTLQKRSRINALSRFPQGLSGDLLQAVLTKLGLRSVERVEGNHEKLDELAAAATAAAMPYRDRNEAIRAGYRRVGSDFPAMGEHWILPTALLESRVDPAKPPMLIYASIGDRPTLLGVGFVVTLRGRTQHEGLIGWPMAWHEHSGLLDDESLAKTRRQDEPLRTRVWVLHAWTQLKNPDGPYAAENWALPFARAGVRVVGTPPREAAEAVALAVGGEEHLRARLRAASNDDRPATGIDEDIERARADAQSIMRRWSADSIVSESDLEALALTWRSLRTTLIATLGPSAASALGAMDAGHNHAGSGKP